MGSTVNYYKYTRARPEKTARWERENAGGKRSVIGLLPNIKTGKSNLWIVWKL